LPPRRPSPDGRLGLCSAPVRPASRASGRLIESTWLCLAAVILAARAASAGEGIYLTWNDCWNAPNARSDLVSGCPLVGGQSLFCSFTLAGAIDSVVAVDVVVDVQLAAATLPAWWQLSPGGCRSGALGAGASLPRPACGTPTRYSCDGPPASPRQKSTHVERFATWNVPDGRRWTRGAEIPLTRAWQPRYAAPPAWVAK
jgi:hypothetical protein